MIKLKKDEYVNKKRLTYVNFLLLRSSLNIDIEQPITA